MNQPIRTVYAFGEFCLDVGERRLLRSGVEVALSPKVFDTLVLLVESAGHLIEKDEFMKRLWPDTSVGDDALARNISTLRKCLGESGDSQALIETVPTRGYRFVAAVRQISLAELSAPVGTVSKSIVEGPSVARSWLRRATFVIVALGVGLLAGLVTFWLLAPVPGPRVRSITQITHSGRVEAGLRMASDGSRIYFLERYGDHWNLMQTSVAGGEPQPVAAPFRNTWVLDVSPDGTNLLIASFSRGGERNPLWTWPVQGGAPKRIGEITAYHAAWYPNGRQILYTEDDGIYQIDADGTNARKFTATDGIAANLRWSPDGRRLCFFTYRPQVEGTTMWEINSDGTHLHRLLPGWGKPTARSLGFWTADGRYFVFESMYSEKQDIWAMREERSLFRRQAEQPARLTAGPLNYGAMLAGKDGHTVFVTGADWRNELVRYDLQSGQFHPFLPDLHTIFMSYSHDGVWLAYVRENSVLARMKFDGTQPLDLIPPGLRIWDPRWSPDGTQILFTGLTEKGQKKIFLVSAEGGTPRELLADNGIQEEASWSPDGKFIAFVSSGGSAASAQVVHVLNLATNELAVLPGSRDMNEPIWSPDGHFLATVANDGQQLMLLDLRRQKWTQLAGGTLLYRGPFAWSRDSKYVYCQDILAPNEPVYRIRVSDRQQELVTTFENFLRGGVQRAAVIAVDPDGSPVAVLRRNAADIYALDLDLP